MVTSGLSQLKNKWMIAMHKVKTFLSTIVGLAIVAGGGIAYGPQAWAQQERRDALEEIIVTAQKRDQALAEIPMSITVLDGAELARQQADNFQDLVALVPGLSINSATRGVTRLTLRGINTGGVASTVGVYVDDVPFGSSTGLANGAILSGDFDTFDIARIEVLRGPQGTLYGASSLGGVLKYVPNRASVEAFEAKLKGSVESVANADPGYAVMGMVNLPVSDRFALRASGFYRADDGFIDSIGNNPIASLTDPAVNVIEGTQVKDGLNSLDTFGGRISALYMPTDTLSIDVAVLAQNIESGAPDTIDADPETLAPLYGDYVQSRYQDQDTDIDYRVYSATVDWDFDAAALQSVTSYGIFEQDFQNDAAIAAGLTGGTPLSALVTFLFDDPGTPEIAPLLSSILPQITNTEKFTQEFRLVSPESETFDWLLGAYYTNENSLIDQTILAVDAGTENVAAGIPVLAVASVASNYEELAFFGNATWHISPRFEISFGARTSNNDQNATQVTDGPLAGGALTVIRGSSSESPFTWSFSPRFAVNDDTSIYVRAATGFRPGGPNILPPGAPPGTPASYDSDSLTSYEAGVKTALDDGRFALDFAAYFLDWDDIQLFTVVNGFGVNANGGTAESKGLEFTASFFPADGLSLSFNGAYTDAQLTQDTSPQVGGLDGDSLSYVPEWSFGIAADYEWAVRGDAMAYVGGNLGYTGERPAGLTERATDGSIVELDSYTTLNLRGGLETGRWSFEVYAKNLTDETGVNSIVSTNTVATGRYELGIIRPRTFGVSVGARF
ncbi:MAG TPA: TonB-dependent receptor [Woeseiaceae bacterium]|nr:TonB-dependent receptor [Woeseiaceae bacterium]